MRYRFTIELDTLDGEEAFTVYLEASTRAREVGENVTTQFDKLDQDGAPVWVHGQDDERLSHPQGLTG